MNSELPGHPDTHDVRSLGYETHTAYSLSGLGATLVYDVQVLKAE